LQQHELHNTLLQLGLPDKFLAQGDPAKMLADCGLDAAGIAASIRHKIKAKNSAG
jgi:1-deoxy-D-xylulose-5-phosphate synthase